MDLNRLLLEADLSASVPTAKALSGINQSLFVVLHRLAPIKKPYS
jgi:hypothetical protein